MLASGGCVLVADEPVGDEFAAPVTSVQERLAYGWSVVSCLPGAMGDPRSAATGAVLRPPVLRAHAREAGLTGFEVLPLDVDFWRFYLLTP